MVHPRIPFQGTTAVYQYTAATPCRLGLFIPVFPPKVEYNAIPHCHDDRVGTCQHPLPKYNVIQYHAATSLGVTCPSKVQCSTVSPSKVQYTTVSLPNAQYTFPRYSLVLWIIFLSRLVQVRHWTMGDYFARRPGQNSYNRCECQTMQRYVGCFRCSLGRVTVQCGDGMSIWMIYPSQDALLLSICRSGW